MPSRKLFLLDGNSILYRAYFAFASHHLTDGNGNDTGALFGFLRTLIDILRKEQPDYIAISFDPSGGSFRSEIYPAYKAQREKAPDGIVWSYPPLFAMLDALKIPIYQTEGYEADDTIGTLAKKAVQEGLEVYMVTADKDYVQLIEPQCSLYHIKHKGGYEVWQEQEAIERYELNSTRQFIDYLALVGDKSDNIPGCPNIGEKSASKLLRSYHTLEGIYEHLDELTPKQRQYLQEGKESTLLSRTLATIQTQVPLEIAWEQLRRQTPHWQELKTLLDRYRLNLYKEFVSSSPTPSEGAIIQETISEGLFATPEESPSAIPESEETLSTLDTTPHQYHLIQEPTEQQALWARLAQSDCFAFDTETDGIDPLTAHIVGVSFAPAPGEAYFMPLPEDTEACIHLLAPLQALMQNRAILKLAHNAKFDIHILKRYGIAPPAPLVDTMLAHYIVEPEGRHSLDEVAKRYLHYKPIAYNELSPKKGFDLRHDVSLETLSRYAAEDADVVLKLYPLLLQKLQEEGQEKLLLQVEMPLLYVLQRMEENGAYIDAPLLANAAQKLRLQLIQLEQEIYQQAGYPFNISSPQQVGELLFDTLQIAQKPKKTKTGKYVTREEELLTYQYKHPIVEMILNYRALKKLLSTYVEALPSYVLSDGCIHTSYNQAVTYTGRLSSSNPNLQNIPIRSALGQEIREAFSARTPERLFMSADYSQIELRLMAHFSEDPHLIAAFEKGEDIHSATAARIYNISPDEVTALQRSHAKTANFGIIYGVSAYGLSRQLNIAPAESKALIDSYYTSYPKVQQFIQKTIEKSREKGYTETLLGRRRYLSKINDRNATVRAAEERIAVNTPLQGTAAELIKLAMIEINQEMQKRNFKSLLVMQVHDELNFDVVPEELDELKELVHRIMTQALPNLKVPLEVEIGVGRNWLEAH